MNQPQTPDNEVAMQTPLTEILRSVPKSCREMIQDGEHSHRNIPYGRLCHQAATELTEKANEVARLRDENKKLRSMIEKAMGPCSWPEYDKQYPERLAPASEEPMRKCPHDIKGWCHACHSFHEPAPEWRELGEDEVIQKGDEVARLREKVERQAERIRYLEGATNHACGTPLSRANREIDRLKAELARLAPSPEEPIVKESLSVEPSPDWRVLGPDEVIQEGDEVKGVGGEWFPVKLTIGSKAGECGSAIFRTRRQLPKQEELPDSCCYCSDCNIPMKLHPEGTLSCPNYKNHEKLKQEEMPLESDLQKMEAIAEGSWGYEAKGFGLMTSHAIRYLRDEIQKLQATVNKTTSNS